jgi:hypothetical protein
VFSVFAGMTAIPGFSQKTETVSICIDLVFGAEPLTLDDQYYKLNETDSVQFEQLRFYISSVQFFHSREITYSEVNSYHLLDASNPSSLKFGIQMPVGTPYDQLRFKLGIDSMTNVSGALGGELDPTLGMYWTWHSGYINVKMEGSSSLCKTRRNEFSLHLGGYQYPNSALQEIVLSIPYQKEIHIRLDLQKFLAQVNLAEHNQIMSPGPTAVQISSILSQTFSVP